MKFSRLASTSLLTSLAFAPPAPGVARVEFVARSLRERSSDPRAP